MRRHIGVVFLAMALMSGCTDLTTIRYDPILEDRSKLAMGTYLPNGALQSTRIDYDTRRRTLALFFDGTANNYTTQTNVRRLFEMVGNIGDPRNVLYYAEGVGGFTERIIDNPISIGSAIGAGTSRDVRQAYLFLAENYRAGGEAGRPAGVDDEVLAFGFSRGSFTARSLLAMVNLYGGVPDLTPCEEFDGAFAESRWRTNPVSVRSGTAIRCPADTTKYTAHQREEIVTELFELYRNYGYACEKERRQVGEIIVVNPGGEDAEPQSLLCERLTKDIDGMRRNLTMRPMSLSFLGIWDTVRTLGLEALCQFRPDAPPNPNHSFHRAGIYGNVTTVRHAVAADERRQCYELVITWDNSTRSHPVYADIKPDIKEVWFPGDHSDVGGGYSKHKALAGVSLRWMLHELEEALRGDETKAPPNQANTFWAKPTAANIYADPYAPVHDLASGWFFRSNEVRKDEISKRMEDPKYFLKNGRKRVTIHWSLACRIQERPSSVWPTYKPRNLPGSLTAPGSRLIGNQTDRNNDNFLDKYNIDWTGLPNENCPPKL